jgi:hypothetical protein
MSLAANQMDQIGKANTCDCRALLAPKCADCSQVLCDRCNDGNIWIDDKQLNLWTEVICVRCADVRLEELRRFHSGEVIY